jgi:hypothetical protein
MGHVIYQSKGIERKILKTLMIFEITWAIPRTAGFRAALF